MGHDDLATLAVIPARWASTRFPGKPLADLAGRPMISHVIERAASAATIDEVLVATDDERIALAASAAGASAVMTGECASGTDRIAAAIAERGDWSMAVNVQGDEPLLAAENIDELVRGMNARPRVPIGTLCRPLSADRLGDSNAVKVVRRNDGLALYFSRSAIPYPRTTEVAATLWRLHLGIYAFRRDSLRRFVNLGPSALEQAEGLEQLRALENGMEVLVLDAPRDAWGVDTPEDLRRAEAALRAEAQA